MLKEAGVDTASFKAHSTRGASVSAAAQKGVTTNDILQTADWSTDCQRRNLSYEDHH